MRLLQLTILYLLIGLACAAWRLRARREGAVADASLMVFFWPLMAPVTWAVASPPAAAASSCPAESWLPDPGLGHELESRLAWARARIEELDALLVQPAFDLPAARRCAERLGPADSSPRAAVAASRVGHIERLIAHRDRLRGELETIDELRDQLSVQAAVVRLTGTDAGDDAGLEAALLARVELLDELVALSAIPPSGRSGLSTAPSVRLHS